jgi:DNA-binding response OmpR family regulator
MISAYDDRNSVAAALERGANKFLTKPVNFPQLKSDVAAVIAEAPIGLSPEALCRAHLQVASAVGPLWVEAVEKRICRGRLADLRNQIAAGLQADPGTQARIACSSGPTPMIAITRFML